MFCNDCQTTDNLIETKIIAHLPDGPEKIYWTFCRDCLIKKNLYCVRHERMKVLQYVPEMEAHPKELKVFSCCFACCEDSVRDLPEEAAQHYVELIQGSKSQALLWFDTVAKDHLRSADFSLSKRMTFGLYVLAEFHNATPEKAVADLVMCDGEDEVPLRN
jgi:hypothetical protein